MDKPNGEPPKKQTGMRLPKVAQQQLADLMLWWGERKTAAVVRAIERAWNEEQAKRGGKQ